MSIDESDDSNTKKKISQPPLNLLFNPSLIDKQDVWKIDIVKLLETLLELLTISGNKDLRVCGVAILTSSLIHRLKVESIFRLEKIANQKDIIHDKDTNVEIKLPIPELANLSLPFRKEIAYPASLEELLLILENMITELSSPPIRKNLINLEPVETFDFQEYLLKFEKIIEEYEFKLFEKIEIEKEMIFNDFVFDMDNLEMARYFIAMLYLAMKGKIDISYEKSKEINKSQVNESILNDNNDVMLQKDQNVDSIKMSVVNN
ncbi:MAG: chromosome segregation protein ScpA [Thermoproteota archaeon]|nr:chromosome segregation protein ScpA [Thermoproteota archaeon]